MEEQPPYEPPEVWVPDEKTAENLQRLTVLSQDRHMTRICLLVITHYNCIAGAPSVKVTIMLEELLGLGHGGAE